MVIVHVVHFKVNKSATAEQVLAMIEGIRSLRTIDGVLSLRVGVQDSRIYPEYRDRSKGYTHSLLVELENAEALRNYAAHPSHQRVIKELIRPIVDFDEILAVDYTDFPPNGSSTSAFGNGDASLPLWCRWPHATSVLALVGAVGLGALIGSRWK